MVKNANFMIFNRVFSRNTLNGFIKNDYPTPYITAIRRSSIDPKNKKNNNIINEIYKYMTDNYRNEYIYKNTLLKNKLLTSTEGHSIEDSTVLTEIPVGKSKADFILINGIAEVFEIKTELDNFDKLEHQINDYYKAFDHISIVVSSEKLSELRKYLSRLNMGSSIGIYVLDKNLELQREKKAKREKNYLKHLNIFKILRKKEYENIIINNLGKLPDVSQFDYYKECLKCFRKIKIDDAYSAFCEILKKRCSIEKEYFLSLPMSINSLVYFSNIGRIEQIKLSNFLNSKYYGGDNVLSLS